MEKLYLDIIRLLAEYSAPLPAERFNPLLLSVARASEKARFERRDSLLPELYELMLGLHTDKD